MTQPAPNPQEIQERVERVAAALAIEDYLPQQIASLPGWTEPIADPIRFVVNLPVAFQGRPFTLDETIELHWWTSMLTHLNALALAYRKLGDEPQRYRVEKAMREAQQLLRAVYGPTVAGACFAGAFGASGVVVPEEVQPGHELGWWAMAIQTSFGLLCTTAAAVGTFHPRVPRLQAIYDRVRHGAMAVYCDDAIGQELIAVCTGVPKGTLQEKLDQWRDAAEETLEGAPDAAAEVLEPLVSTAEALYHDRAEATGTTMHPKPNLD